LSPLPKTPLLGKDLSQLSPPYYFTPVVFLYSDRCCCRIPASTLLSLNRLMLKQFFGARFPNSLSAFPPRTFFFPLMCYGQCFPGPCASACLFPPPLSLGPVLPPINDLRMTPCAKNSKNLPHVRKFFPPSPFPLRFLEFSIPLSKRFFQN